MLLRVLAVHKHRSTPFRLSASPRSKSLGQQIPPCNRTGDCAVRSNGGLQFAVELR